jgi:hypothetical protein
MSHFKLPLVLLLAFTVTGNTILGMDLGMEERKQSEGDFWREQQAQQSQRDAELARVAQIEEIFNSAFHQVLPRHPVYNRQNDVIPVERLRENSSEEGSSDELQDEESADEPASENHPGRSLKPLAQAAGMGVVTALATRQAIKFAKTSTCTYL